MRTVVPDDLDGARADRAVAALFDVSRSVARRTIDAGGATRGGMPLRPSDAVAAGDELAVTIAEVEQKVEAEDVDFGVAYEDDHVIVVDKPAGLVVHPGAGTSGGTLANGLLGRFAWAGELGPDRRWGIVHRLDRDTSGLLIVAKTAEAHDTLQDALRERAVTRRYLALTSGRFVSATGTIDAPIGRDPSNRTRMAVIGGGRPARTHYRRLATWHEPEATLLSVELETGRTHQIRVHLQAIDHPIIGDPVYGPTRDAAGDPGRTWLHATELVFEHPSGVGEVAVQSALPDDLAASLQQLGPPISGSISGEDGPEE
jgi:23S rRNA pseudouridine1911/1915/1917 synthase